jgi:hypothetical protein
MASYRKFSDALKNGNYALAPPNSPKASKADTLGGLGALDGLRPEAQKPAAAPESAELIAPSPAPTLATLAALAAHARESRDTGAGPDAELIAPSPWFESVARPSEGEPGFEHPWPARRGRSAPSAADGVPTAMASTFVPDGSVTGIALRIGQKAPCDDDAVPLPGHRR